MTSDEFKKLEKLVENLVKRVETLEGVKRSEKSSSSKLEKPDGNARPKPQSDISKIESFITSNLGNLGMLSVVVITLHIRSKQTKAEILDKVKAWGGTKKNLNWFVGGNFKQRLVNEGIVFEDGKNEAGKNLYSLTKGKGVKLALSIIEKLESKN